jgi:hypothetical protein
MRRCGSDMSHWAVVVGGNVETDGCVPYALDDLLP